MQQREKKTITNAQYCAGFVIQTSALGIKSYDK